MAHIHYLHNDTFGNQGQPEIRGMTCSQNAYGIEATFRLHNKPVSALWEFSKVSASSPAGKGAALVDCSVLIGCGVLVLVPARVPFCFSYHRALFRAVPLKEVEVLELFHSWPSVLVHAPCWCFGASFCFIRFYCHAAKQWS